MINFKLIRRLKFLLKNMDIKLCNRQVSLKWFIIVNFILFVGLFVFIDLYFYAFTKHTRKPMIDSKAIVEQENYLKKMRSRKKHNNCLAFGIDENKFEPHDEEDVVKKWTIIKSPYDPHFVMHSNEKDFSSSDRDYILYDLMHKYIYKNSTTSSECELVMDIGGDSCGPALYAAAHSYNVILFEPFREQNIMSRESIGLNSFHDICVTSMNSFVSNGDEENVIYSIGNRTTQPINSIAIDTFLNSNNFLSQCLIQHMRIDLHAFNPNVIFGSRSSIKSLKVKSLLFKYEPWLELNFLPFKTWDFLLPFVSDLFVRNDKPLFYVLMPGKSKLCYGPIKSKFFQKFHDEHLTSTERLAVDVLVIFDKQLKGSFLTKVKCNPVRFEN